MNKLPLPKRLLILNMLVEGSSLRSISRVADVSINTVAKLLADAGETAIDLHDKLVRDVKGSKIQCDEIWSFNHAIRRTGAAADATPLDVGDIWTWTALDTENKLIVTYAVGDQTLSCVKLLMEDLKQRLANRVQLTSGGHRAYMEAVEEAFGHDVDFSQIQKPYDPTSSLPGRSIGTSNVEVLNSTIRMQNCRFARQTTPFSKKVDNHLHALALFFLHYNFVRIHKSLKITPAMAAGVADNPWSFGDIAEAIDARHRTQSGQARSHVTRTTPRAVS